MSPVTASEKDTERTIKISDGTSCSRVVVYGRAEKAVDEGAKLVGKPCHGE